MRITPNFDAASPARLAKCFALTAAAARSTGSARSMRCDVFADSFDIFSYWRSVSETHSPVYLLSCFGPVFAGGPLVIRFSLLLYRPLFRLCHRPVSCDLTTLIHFFFPYFTSLHSPVFSSRTRSCAVGVVPAAPPSIRRACIADISFFAFSMPSTAFFPLPTARCFY